MFEGFAHVQAIILILIISTIGELYNSLKEHGTILWTPQHFYERTELSRVGAYFAFSVMCVISPFMGIAKLIYWLRKRKEKSL
jgi:hypothetical protein